MNKLQKGPKQLQPLGFTQKEGDEPMNMNELQEAMQLIDRETKEKQRKLEIQRQLEEDRAREREVKAILEKERKLREAEEQKFALEKKQSQGENYLTLEDVKQHNQKSDAWMVYNGVVYDVTNYMGRHPGGVANLMKGVGIDATALINSTHSWINVSYLLSKNKVGVLVPKGAKTSLSQKK